MNLGRIGEHRYELHVMGEKKEVVAALSEAHFLDLKFRPGLSAMGDTTIIETDASPVDLGEVDEYLSGKGFVCELVTGHN